MPLFDFGNSNYQSPIRYRRKQHISHMTTLNVFLQTDLCLIFSTVGHHSLLLKLIKLT